MQVSNIMHISTSNPSIHRIFANYKVEKQVPQLIDLTDLHCFVGRYPKLNNYL